MTPSNIELLSNPQPGVHIVYPYSNEAHLAEVVSFFAGAGIRKGEAVVIVTSSTHCEPVLDSLEQNGFDIARLQESGQLVCKDASDLLGTFMFNGIIDEHRFETKMGGIIQNAKFQSGLRPVRVFGEMVDLIWKSNPKATHRLEELWNKVIGKHSISLLCAYSLSGAAQPSLPVELVACHSHCMD